MSHGGTPKNGSPPTLSLHAGARPNICLASVCEIAVFPVSARPMAPARMLIKQRAQVVLERKKSQDPSKAEQRNEPNAKICIQRPKGAMRADMGLGSRFGVSFGCVVCAHGALGHRRCTLEEQVTCGAPSRRLASEVAVEATTSPKAKLCRLIVTGKHLTCPTDQRPPKAKGVH